MKDIVSEMHSGPMNVNLPLSGMPISLSCFRGMKIRGVCFHSFFLGVSCFQKQWLGSHYNFHVIFLCKHHSVIMYLKVLVVNPVLY